jgi:hypothetical protein
LGCKFWRSENRLAMENTTPYRLGCADTDARRPARVVKAGWSTMVAMQKIVEGVAAARSVASTFSAAVVWLWQRRHEVAIAAIVLLVGYLIWSGLAAPDLELKPPSSRDDPISRALE